MFEGLTDLITTFFKWAVRITVAVLLFGLYASIVTTVTNALGSVAGSSVLNEIALLVQVWLPFNLAVVFNWIMVTTMTIFLYFAYKYVYSLMSSITGH